MWGEVSMWSVHLFTVPVRNIVQLYENANEMRTLKNVNMKGGETWIGSSGLRHSWVGLA